MQNESQRLKNHKSMIKDNQDKKVDLKQQIFQKNKESKEIETQNAKTRELISKLRKGLDGKK